MTDTLAPRQSQVIALVVVGRSNKEIARVLRINEATVKNHCSDIYRVLGARNRPHAAALWWQRTREACVALAGTEGER